MVQAPIFHVNGDDPEACVRVARLAFAYRQRFHKDVVIDMVCYRRLGHNEGDDPSYTQPLMYKRIDARRSVRKLYTEALVKRGDITLEEAEKALDDFQGRLQEALEQTRRRRRRRAPRPSRAAAGRRAAPRRHRRRPGRRSTASTTCCRRAARGLHASTPSWPSSSRPARRCSGGGRGRLGAGRGARRSARCCSRAPTSGSPGQDTRRGTFSQRHAVLVDYQTDAEYVPARPPRPRPGEVLDLRLAAVGVRGDRLRVRLLGREPAGAGAAGRRSSATSSTAPRSSSTSTSSPPRTSGARQRARPAAAARLRGPGPRALARPASSGSCTLCAEDNIQVANATTAAQYFHLLRRQMHRDVRKPLIVFTPKSLLRAKSARSHGRGRSPGLVPRGARRPGLAGDPDAVQRVVLASGKVGHDAIAARDEAACTVAGAPGRAALPVAVRRSWPRRSTATRNAAELVWLQEEPENMGPWNFVKGRLYEALGDRFTIKRVSRFESGSPGDRLEGDPRPGAGEHHRGGAPRVRARCGSASRCRWCRPTSWCRWRAPSRSTASTRSPCPTRCSSPRRCRRTTRTSPTASASGRRTRRSSTRSSPSRRWRR